MGKGNTVLITGSSLGIGRETAYRFAKNGWGVILTYNKDRKPAIEAAGRCKALGAKDVLVVKLDITNNASIRNAVKKTVNKFKRMAVLVNNAGVVVINQFDKQTPEDIEKQVRTNLEGLMKVTRECLPYIDGAIINVSSIAGKTPFATVAPYCATKFGIRGFTQALALEQRGLRIYAVNPGMTATRMTNFKGVAPEKVAGIIFNAAEGKYKIKSGGDIDVEKYLRIQ
jgi:NAD(P)-dependent dehydrogenase (short-subunit alcohol dehydrogenase family)